MVLKVDTVTNDLLAVQKKQEDPLKSSIENGLTELGNIDVQGNLKRAMDVVFRTRNLVRLALSGIKIEDEQLKMIGDDSLDNVKPLPVEPSLIKGLAERLYKSAKVKSPYHRQDTRGLQKGSINPQKLRRAIQWLLQGKNKISKYWKKLRSYVWRIEWTFFLISQVTM